MQCMNAKNYSFLKQGDTDGASLSWYGLLYAGGNTKLDASLIFKEY